MITVSTWNSLFYSKCWTVHHGSVHRVPWFSWTNDPADIVITVISVSLSMFLSFYLLDYILCKSGTVEVCVYTPKNTSSIMMNPLKSFILFQEKISFLIFMSYPQFELIFTFSAEIAHSVCLQSYLHELDIHNSHGCIFSCKINSQKVTGNKLSLKQCWQLC